MRKAPKSQNIEKWLCEWEKVYKDCRKVNLPEVDGYRLVKDFVYAVESVLSSWSEYWRNELQRLKWKKERLPTLYDIIEVYRNHRRLDSVQKVRSQHGSYAASFKGELINKPRSEDKSETKPEADSLRADKKEWTKPCLCGMPRPYRNCYYLIESIRPSG